jgi:tetratricopeptide (TPR) repeat protein
MTARATGHDLRSDVSGAPPRPGGARSTGRHLRAARRALLLAIALLAAPGWDAARPFEQLPPATPRSPDLPDLTRFSAQVRRHIEAREAWHRQIVEGAASSAQQLAADGELALLYHAYQLYPAAERLYARVLERAPEHRWAYYLAQICRSTDRPVESVRRFHEALDLAPADVPTLIRLAEVYIDQDRIGDAEPLLEQALAAAPETAAAHYYLGQIAAARDRPDLAIPRFERALELQPTSTAIHTPLGLAYRDRGELEAARKHLGAAGSVDVALDDPLMERLHALSQTLWEVLRRAQEKLESGDRPEAAAALAQAAAIDPLAPEPRLMLGMVLGRDESQAEAAERQLELAAFLDPADARAPALLAASLRARGARERAVEQYREALERGPDAGRVRFDLAQTLQSLGRLEDAAVEYGRAAQTLGDNPIALLGEATVLIELDRCSVALEHIEAGLQRVPNQGVWVHALVRLLVGCPQSHSTAPERALELAQRLFAARSTPGHAAAVAMSLAASGHHAQAVEWQRRAVELARKIGRDDLAALLEADVAVFGAGRGRDVPWRIAEMDLFSAGIAGAPGPSNPDAR